MNKQASLGTAVITGASTGIGASYADRLAARGYDLILVARRGDVLKQVADGLSQRHGINARSIAADLTSAQDVARLEQLLREDSSITAARTRRSRLFEYRRRAWRTAIRRRHG